MEKTISSGPEIGQAMRTLMEVCGFKIPENTSMPLYEAIAFIGHMAHTKGMGLNLSDLEHIKKTVKDMLPESEPAEEAPQPEELAQPAGWVDLLDGYYVRYGSTAIAWRPTYSEASEMEKESHNVYNFGKMSILPAYDLAPEDFVSLREKYYANT